MSQWFKLCEGQYRWIVCKKFIFEHSTKRGARRKYNFSRFNFWTTAAVSAKLPHGVLLGQFTRQSPWIPISCMRLFSLPEYTLLLNNLWSEFFWFCPAVKVTESPSNCYTVWPCDEFMKFTHCTLNFASLLYIITWIRFICHVWKTRIGSHIFCAKATTTFVSEHYVASSWWW